MPLFRLLILYIVSVTLFSCTSNPKPPQSSVKTESSQVLNLNIGAEPTVLNPLLLTDSASHAVVNMIFDGLFRITPDMELVPDLAEGYKVSKSGLEYTFTLKKDLFWHDGKPVTAHDVKFTFDAIIDPKTNTVRRSQFLVEGKPIAWTVIDNRTIKATLPAPFAPFLSTLVMEIIPKHLYENKDINTHPNNRKPIGTGAFVFVDWKTGQYVSLKRNDKFHRGAPKLKQIIYKIIPDTNTSLSAFEKGELDIEGIPHKDVHRFKKNAQIQLLSGYSLSYSYMGMNIHKPELKDVRVRRAINHAINRDALVQAILKGNGQVAHIPSSPSSWAYPDEDKIHKYAYNPEKSRELLTAAGYTYNASSKLFEKDGKPLKLTLKTSKGAASSIKMAQIIQQFLGQTGISLDIQMLEWSSFLKVMHDKTHPRDFDLVILGWSFDINDPDDTYTVWHSSGYPNGANLNGYQNPRVDDLLEKGRRELNQEKRKAIYTDIFAQISKDAPYVFLFHSRSSIGAYKYVKGLAKPGPGGLLNPIEGVYIDR